MGSSTSFHGTGFDSAGAVVAGGSAAGVLHDPLPAVLMEQLDYILLYRWFVGLGWMMRCGTTRCSARTATRLLEAAVAAKFLAAVLAPTHK
jgi:hypothetical protein